MAYLLKQLRSAVVRCAGGHGIGRRACRTDVVSVPTSSSPSGPSVASGRRLMSPCSSTMAHSGSTPVLSQALVMGMSIKLLVACALRRTVGTTSWRMKGTSHDDWNYSKIRTLEPRRCTLATGPVFANLNGLGKPQGTLVLFQVSLLARSVPRVSVAHAIQPNKPADVLVDLGQMCAGLMHVGRTLHSRGSQRSNVLLVPRRYSHSAQRAHLCSQHQRRGTCSTPLAAPAAQPVAQVAESGVLTDLLTMTLAGGIIAGVTLSALPLLSGRAQVRRRPCTTQGSPARSQAAATAMTSPSVFVC